MIFFKKKSDTHFYLFENIVKISRNKKFYENCEILDTTDGRFEILVLHVSLIIRRINNLGHTGLAQSLVDLMFSSIDLSFREEGVGDLSIPKKMKKIGQVFYGRLAILDSILDSGPSKVQLDNLESYFLRNAFSSNKDYINQSRKLANYSSDINKKIKTLNIDNIVNLDTEQFDIF
tara:strand:+ start:26468 stop:26995 length:528 start_codon:yes stop_codon:yes gene_type:complete